MIVLPFLNKYYFVYYFVKNDNYKILLCLIMNMIDDEMNDHHIISDHYTKVKS